MGGRSLGTRWSIRTKCELVVFARNSDRNTSADIVMWFKVEEVDIVTPADSGNIRGVECSSGGIVF